MRVLALDTTARTGSVALVENDRVVLERSGDAARSHAERLPGDLLLALEERGWRPADVDVFAVVAGPGSFTGLRIGIATMQGMAFVERKPIVPVSGLDVLAHVAAAERAAGTRVGAWIDAHRREVYGALYAVADGPPFSPERLRDLDAPSVAQPAALLARWSALVPRVDLFVGDGAEAYAAVAEAHGELAPTPRLAGAAGLIAAVLARRGEGVDPRRVHPIYIRRPDAEVARDRARTAP